MRQQERMAGNAGDGGWAHRWCWLMWYSHLDDPTILGELTQAGIVHKLCHGL